MESGLVKDPLRESRHQLRNRNVQNKGRDNQDSAVCRASHRVDSSALHEAPQRVL